MSDQVLSDRPLTKLTSIKSLREVDSPRSEKADEPESLPLCRKITAPVTTEAHNLYLQDLELQSALECSIDDLFSKIEKITSEFTSTSTQAPGSQTSISSLPLTPPAQPLKLAVKPPESPKKPIPREKKVKEKQQFKVLQPIMENMMVFQARPIDTIEKSDTSKLTISQFELGKIVGSGKFGDVFQCRHKSTGTLYALKKIFKSTIKQYNMIEQFTEELRIHYRLNHPNIVKLYTHFEDEYHIFLLLEYIDGGMLMKLIKSDEKFVSKSMIQVLRAVDYLHRNHIAHRDIKPENIVVSNGILKLCDFGWAANCESGMKRTFCGTLDYVSPEILEEREYNLNVDLWSLGILTFQLLAGFPPFQQDIPKLKMNRIKNVDKSNVIYPPQIEDQARDFIGRFLRKDPSERMMIRESFNHAFVKKYNMRERDEAPEDIGLLLS